MGRPRGAAGRAAARPAQLRAHLGEPVAAALARRYRLIALDHRGRGDSDWDPADDYSTGAYVSDLEQFADSLALERFALVGHSMGGTNGLVYAARNPRRVRLLAVEDIGPGSSVSGAGAQRIRRELAHTPQDFAGIAEARAYWRGVRPDISDAALESRVENTLRRFPDGRWAWKFDLDGITRARLDPDPARHVDLWPHVEGLRCPVLVIRVLFRTSWPPPPAPRWRRGQPLLRWVEIPAAGA